MKKFKHTSVKFLLPTGIPEILDTYCQQNSTFKKPETEYYKHLYITHKITSHFNSHNSLGYNTEYSGCPIHVQTIATILGVKNGKACDLLKTQEEIGIIKRIGIYVPGLKSFSYKLAVKPEEFTLVTSLPKYSIIPSKIIERGNIHSGGESVDLKLYKKVFKHLTLDIPSDYIYAPNQDKKGSRYNYSSHTSYPSYTYTSQSLPPMMGNFETHPLKHSTTDISVILKNELYESNTLNYSIIQKTNPMTFSLEAILNGDFYVLRPDEKSRVYTNLTNLKRENRPLLRFDGKHLVELDIRNSQPLIASILIRDHWVKKRRIIPEDVIQYQKDCEIGTFYDHFMHINNVPTESRGDFKAKMFGEVFFSKVSNRKTKLKKQFIKKYPNVYEAICFIKGGLGCENYNQFAIQLQQKEANIIFDNVNMGLLKCGIPAFNIFDSILCLPEHQEIARDSIFSAFGTFGIKPTINFKDYGKPF